MSGICNVLQPTGRQLWSSARSIVDPHQLPNGAFKHTGQAPDAVDGNDGTAVLHSHRDAL